MALEDEAGDIVGKARRGMGSTVDQLSRATGISSSDLELIEACTLKPDRAQAMKLAQALLLDGPKLADIASESWEPAPVALPQGDVLIQCVAVPYGAYGENCYILGCAHTKDAAVVDPGGAVEHILHVLSDLGLNLDVVLITHAHADHVGGLRELLSTRPNVRLANHMLERESVTRGLSARWEAAKNEMHVALGNLRIMVLSTPGHTPGSTCYLADGVCFVGDTIFAGSIGRPADRKDYRQMLAEIRLKILSLPDETILLPGHGPATTVAEEKAHNPFF